MAGRTPCRPSSPGCAPAPGERTRILLMPPSLAQIIDKADWLCYGLDRDNLLLHFLQIDEPSMDAMVFLGHRDAGAPVTVSYPIEQVIDAVLPTQPARASRFIL